MSENYIFIIAGVLLGLILLLRKVLTKHNNRFILHIILFTVCISVLSYHFYVRKMTEGFIAIALGSIAFGKYIYDTRKK